MQTYECINNNEEKETTTYPMMGSLFYDPSMWRKFLYQILSSYYLHTLILHIYFISPKQHLQITWIHLLFLHFYMSLIKSYEELLFFSFFLFYDIYIYRIMIFWQLYFNIFFLQSKMTSFKWFLNKKNEKSLKKYHTSDCKRKLSIFSC